VPSNTAVICECGSISFVVQQLNVKERGETRGSVFEKTDSFQVRHDVIGSLEDVESGKHAKNAALDFCFNSQNTGGADVEDKPVAGDEPLGNDLEVIECSDLVPDIGLDLYDLKEKYLQINSQEDIGSKEGLSYCLQPRFKDVLNSPLATAAARPLAEDASAKPLPVGSGLTVSTPFSKPDMGLDVYKDENTSCFLDPPCDDLAVGPLGLPYYSPLTAGAARPLGVATDKLMPSAVWKKEAIMLAHKNGSGDKKKDPGDQVTTLYLFSFYFSLQEISGSNLKTVEQFLLYTVAKPWLKWGLHIHTCFKAITIQYTYYIVLQELKRVSSGGPKYTDFNIKFRYFGEGVKTVHQSPPSTITLKRLAASLVI